MEQESKNDVNVGTVLKYLRDKSGLFTHSLEDVGLASRSTISNWEHGKNAPTWQKVSPVIDFYLATIKGEYNHTQCNNHYIIPDLVMTLVKRMESTLDLMDLDGVDGRAGRDMLRKELEMLKNELNKEDES